MAKYAANLRYYHGDPLVEIEQDDLDRIARTFGVRVTYERIDNREMHDGVPREETLDKAIEEISQEVITLASEDEARFREALISVYEKYRSPRTPYGFWGSSPEGQRIAKTVADETGGGW